MSNPLSSLRTQALGAYGVPYDPQQDQQINPERGIQGRGIDPKYPHPSIPDMTPINSTVGDVAHDKSITTFTVGLGNMNVDEQNYNTHLEPGDAVWVQGVESSRNNLVEMLNWGQLNNQLREKADILWQVHMKKIDQDVEDFMNLLERYGEGVLQTYHSAKNSRILQILRMGSPVFKENEADIKRFYNLSISPKLYALTSFGCNHSWKFAGFVNTTSDPLRTAASQKLGYARQLSVGVLVHGEHVNVRNVFGGYDKLPSLSRIGFILKRVSDPERQSAYYEKMISNVGGNRSSPVNKIQFEYVPWGSATEAEPTHAETYYYDNAGMLREGIFREIGYMREAQNKKHINETTINLSCGRTGETDDKIRDAGANLPSFIAEVNMK